MKFERGAWTLTTSTTGLSHVRRTNQDLAFGRTTLCGKSCQGWEVGDALTDSDGIDCVICRYRVQRQGDIANR